MIIRNGNIFDAVHRDCYVADILIKDGRIKKIGSDIRAECEEIYDAAGMNVYPGFVEAHGHIALDGYAMGYEGQDYNEYNDSVTPHLRAIDGINPMDEALKQAAEAGVTTVCTGPGSSNVIGGTFTCIKTVGKRVDDMAIKSSVAMKCAFGENPKRCYREKGISSRMSTAAKLRETLFKAKEYLEKKEGGKEPAFDMKLEALIPLLKGEMPLKAHAHQANDIFTAIRIAKEFGLKLTLEHVTEGHLIADELVKEGYYMAVGPSLTNASKIELRNKTFDTPGILAKAGGHVAIITDSPVIPQQYLPLCAGLAVRSGMDRFDALRAVTINAAEHIGVADRVGSIEEGKDADIVICDGDPFDVNGVVKQVFINGTPVIG